MIMHQSIGTDKAGKCPAVARGGGLGAGGID